MSVIQVVKQAIKVNIHRDSFVQAQTYNKCPLNIMQTTYY